MQDEYADETVRAWDAFSDAIKHQSRDWMPGFSPKPKPSAEWFELTTMQNCLALQAASIGYPYQTFNQMQSPCLFAPVSGALALLGI